MQSNLHKQPSKISRLGGRLREVVTYKRLGPYWVKNLILLHNCRDLPMFCMHYSYIKVNFEKNYSTSYGEISVPFTIQDCDNVIQYPLYYLPSGCLREFKNKRKI